jgi:hypothetical protein
MIIAFEGGVITRVHALRGCANISCFPRGLNSEVAVQANKQILACTLYWNVDLGSISDGSTGQKDGRDCEKREEKGDPKYPHHRVL